MDEDDDFGDLYADVHVENSSFVSPPVAEPALNFKAQTHRHQADDDDDADEEEVLYGKNALPPSLPEQQQPSVSVENELPCIEENQFIGADVENFRICDDNVQEVPNNELQVVGQDSHRQEVDDFQESTPIATADADNQVSGLEGMEIKAAEETAVRDEEIEEAEDATKIADAEVDTQMVEAGQDTQMVEAGQDTQMAEAENPANLTEALEMDSSDKVQVQGQVGQQGVLTEINSPANRDSVGIFDFEGTSGKEEDIPGLSIKSSGDVMIPGLGLEEQNEENWVSVSRQDLTSETGNPDFEEGNDLESDSDDDLKILLDDNRPMPMGMYSNPDRREQQSFEQMSEDEDGDDLVIVAGNGDQPLEEQDWVAEPNSPFDGAVSTSGEKAVVADRNGDDRGQLGKAGVLNAPVPRVGYSGHPYHLNNSQFKYVRPGATPNPSTSASVQNNNRHAAAGGGWASGKNGVAAGRGSGQRNFLPWSSGPGSRGFQNGFDFTLPSNKTVFDIDIESFEEKPWRFPGADVTDYFNFNFTEDSWKEYCKKMEQHRLESTMQSKIRVYESGRSEQEYDPDLPMELQSNATRNEAFGENMQNRSSDQGYSNLSGRGRGTGRGRAPIPLGRAIQVEGGAGERRPSVDYRKPRFHDSDAVIQIVVQGASDDENTEPSKAPESANDINESVDSERADCDVNSQKQNRKESGFPTRQIEPWENDGRKNNPGCGMMIRSVHHGDGILPLPPGPPIQCPPSSLAAPGIFIGRMPDQPHPNRPPQLPKPHKMLNLPGNEYSNGGFTSLDVRSNVSDNSRKEISSHGMERIGALEGGYEAGDYERDPSPEASGRNREQCESRSDGQSKRSSEVRVDREAADDHASDQSVKRQKMNSQNDSPRTAAGHSQQLKPSKGSGNKSESCNSRGYSKDHGNTKDYLRSRGKVEEEISSHRNPRALSRERNRVHSEEDQHSYPKDYVWSGRHSSERDSRHQRSRDSLSYRKDEYHLHGEREELYRRRVKDERIEKYRERDEHVRSWPGKIEDTRNMREKVDDLRRREIIGKEEAGSYRDSRDRARDAERDERNDLYNAKRKKDQDDWHPHNSKEDIRRREKEDNISVRPEKVDDSYLKRKREEDLAWKDRSGKEESIREIRAREDIAGERHDKMEDHRRRRKDEELRRRERLDRDQIRDPREREDLARERNERDDAYLRRRDEELRKRERTDKEQGIRDPTREREDLHKEKHEREDDSLRRKDEDMHRRDRADRDEGHREIQEKEEFNRDRHDKDAEYYLKRKEDESRRRALLEESRLRKQRDESWRRREREDEQWRRSALEESHSRREREEDNKSLLPVRSRHHSEERIYHGSDKERASSRDKMLLTSYEKERVKDKRKHDDQRSKFKERGDEISKLKHQERDDMHFRNDRSNVEDRNVRPDRSYHRFDHPGGGHSAEDQKNHWEKRNFDTRNGSIPTSTEDRPRHDHVPTGRKRKAEEQTIMSHEKKAFERTHEEQESIARGSHADHKMTSRISLSNSSKNTDAYGNKLKHSVADESASEDESLKRGRSKLERWTSQKDREEANLWDNEGSKRQKTTASNDESLNRKEDHTNVDTGAGGDTRKKPVKEHSKENEGTVGDQTAKEGNLLEGFDVGDTSRDPDANENKQHSETVAKLEKRRERFKQPIASSNEKDYKRTDNEAVVENDTDGIKERPTRKRRWGNN